MTTEPSTALVTIEQQVAIALKSGEREVQLKEFVEKSKTIVTITNNAGYQECHAARVALKDERIAITKQGKEARDEANRFSKAVIVEEARLVAIIEPEEIRLKAIQDQYDADKELKKQQALALERARVATCQAYIDQIKSLPLSCVGKDSRAIYMVIVEAEKIGIEDSLLEYKDAAIAAKADTIVTLERMHIETLNREEDDAKAKAQIEKMRVEAEALAEANRIAKEVADAELVRQKLEMQKKAQDEANALAAQKEELRIKTEEAEALERSRFEAQEKARKELEDDRKKFEQERDEEIARLAKEKLDAENADKAKKKADAEAEAKFKKDQQDLFEAEEKNRLKAEQEAKALTEIDTQRASESALSSAVATPAANNTSNEVSLDCAIYELEVFCEKYAGVPELAEVISVISSFVESKSLG